jgi:hypothetical protein
MSTIKLRSFDIALLVILVSLLVYGCSSEKPNPDFVDPSTHPELVDQSWLTGKPCALPCWQGLEPGKSIREDVLKTIDGLSFLETGKRVTKANSQDTINCKQPSKNVCMVLDYKKEVLSELMLYLNYSITLDEVIAQIGEPDLVAISPRYNERGDCGFDVVWFNQRLVSTNSFVGKGYLPFQYDLCDQIQESGGKVPKGIEIQTVRLFSPDKMDNFTKNLTEGITYPWTEFSK